MENLVVDFNNGYTVITGQTGAGKSLLLDSVNIILGKRADISILRNKEKNGIIIATFQSKNKDLINILCENGFIENVEEDIIIIKKIISKNGSKIFINDIQTTVQFVNKIANLLLEVYSQFEQTDLFLSKKHLSILDNFSNLTSDLCKIETLYQQMKNEEEKYQKIKEEIEKQKANVEYLQDFIKDVEIIKIQPNEYDELVNKKKDMVNSERIATYINNSFTTFESCKIGNVINKVQENLNRLENFLDEKSSLINNVKNLNELLEDIYIKAQNANEMLDELSSKINFNEQDIDIVEERISAINDISRKYQTTPYELQQQYINAKEKLTKINYSDEILKQSLERVNKIREEYFNEAKNLTQKRKNNAKKLEEMVLEKLSHLKMEKVRFYTSFEEIEPTEKGIDKVVFFASMNNGFSPAPIHKIASGGELSRFMLAFKSSLCSTKETETIIFDEIDTGVSGSVAYAIGKEMQLLSKKSQIICITHNSQTACCANEHLFVAKSNENDITKTIVKNLNYEERIRAIAEMISTDEITDEALQNARKLIEKARL